MSSPPPRTDRLYFWMWPLLSQLPLDGQPGSCEQSFRFRPVGSVSGPMWPMLLMPWSMLSVHCGSPPVPDLVKIWTTPSAASVP